jgi:deazaflavin-dependent oxidoreductase (nitroreductase family)
MGIIENVGRRSGRVYRTPLTVLSTGEGVAILLTYGPDRDWLKNRRVFTKLPFEKALLLTWGE